MTSEADEQLRAELHLLALHSSDLRDRAGERCGQRDSIFIASMMPSTAPSATSSPSVALTESTVPGIGAVTLPSPVST